MNIDDWQKERVMTAKQYRKTIEALALNVAQAGRFIGVSERTSHRYIRGERPVPAAHAMLLRAALTLVDCGMGLPLAVPKWEREGR